MAHIFENKPVDQVWFSQLQIGSFKLMSPSTQLTIDDFKTATKKIQAEEPDVTHWTFGKSVSIYQFPAFQILSLLSI